MSNSVHSKYVQGLKNLTKCLYIHARKAAVAESCKVKKQLLKPERPLSGAAAHNFHIQPQRFLPPTRCRPIRSHSLRVGLQ